MKKHYLWGYGIGLFAALCIVLIWGWAEGAPLFNAQRSIIAEEDNRFFIGTTTPSAIRWNSGHFGTGTSTAANGWNITDGCFAVNGTCLSASGVTGSGVANRLAYFSDVSALTSSADFVVDAALGRLTYTYGSTTMLTATYASSTALTAGNLFSTNASSTYLSTSQNLIAGNTLIVPGLTSALTLTGAAGIFAEYTGASCTAQFIRSLDALGAATCATVANTDLANSTISGVALGGTLAALTATNGTLSFSGSYDGSTARTIGLNLASSNEWTASTTFAGILNVGTGLFASTTIQNLNFNALLGTASGTISTLNVNSGNFGSTTIQRANINACGGDGCNDLYGFLVASSSSLFGTRIDLPAKDYAYTITRVSCYVVGGTSKVITITDGTNAMESITCGLTRTLDDGTLINNTATAGELLRVTMGATSGAVDSVSVSISGIKGQ